MQWINQYEKGKIEVEVNTDELNKRLDIFNVAAQRLAVGIVLLGHDHRLGLCHEHGRRLPGHRSGGGGLCDLHLRHRRRAGAL
jgi:hypothetical protein